MTSKEMEARSGVPRANIRYYEAEGLLTPARAKNGYREYSEDDLAVLEKVKLLRRLGVSVEELLALRRGDESLTAVLDRRLSSLETERETLERVREVCGDLRDAGVTFAALDAPSYLRSLDETRAPLAPLPELPEGDALPIACGPFRRFFARSLDWTLIQWAILAVIALSGNNGSSASGTAISLGAAALMLFLEPLALRLFGTTPGKALLGLSLAGPDGERLPYGEGLMRVLRMAWGGLGLCIPIFNLVQLYRSCKRAMEMEPQPWDEGVAYTEKPFRGGYAIRYLAFAAACFAIVIGLGLRSQFPPNRGNLTVAEFAENFNRQAEYMNLEFGGELSMEGEWKSLPDEPGVITFDPYPAWPEAETFHYTVEDGRLTAVSMSGSLENVSDWYAPPVNQMAVAVMAFVWAQEDAPFYDGPRVELLETVTGAGFEGFDISQAGTRTTLDIQERGCVDSMAQGFLVPMVEGASNFFAFTFTIALEE